jgi:hypothetical protein
MVGITLHCLGIGLTAGSPGTIAKVEYLKFDGHVDYYMPSLLLACTRDGLRLGEARVEVLSPTSPLEYFSECASRSAQA